MSDEQKKMSAKERVRLALEELVRAEKELNEERAHRQILCSCGKFHPICELVLIITHWHTPPRGCTEGDYWNEGEWQFICPVNGRRNRLMFDDNDIDWQLRGRVGAESTFKGIYRKFFASSVKEYDETPMTGHFNNHYVDNNRTHFELPEKGALSAEKKGTSK